MGKTIMILAIATAIIVSIFTTPIAYAQQEAKLVETVELNDIKVKSGELIILLDVTDLGTVDTVHVAANLPCNENKGPNDGAGNDTPDVKIIAGDASNNNFGDVIESISDDTGFVSIKKTCVFHDTVSSADIPGGIITDIVLRNAGDKDVKLKKVVVTISINNPIGLSGNIPLLESIETEVTNIEAKLDDSFFGLAALKSILDQIVALLIGIDTETDKIQMVKDNQYVPFKATGPAGTVTCDTLDGGFEIHSITIENDGTSGVFLITSISVQFRGVNDAADEIIYSDVTIDGNTFLINSQVTGTSTAPHTFEVLGVPLGFGADANFMHQIAAESSGSSDVILRVVCSAVGTENITIDTNAIQVSGWKLPSDTVTVTFS